MQFEATARRSEIFPFLTTAIKFQEVRSTHGIVRNQEKVSQAYETSVRKKRLHTKRTTLPFVVGNEQRFPLLLGANNAFRPSSNVDLYMYRT